MSNGFLIYPAPMILNLALVVVNIVLAFHIGSDLQSVVENPIGQPMATVCSQLFPIRRTPFHDIDLQIFANSVGSTGTVVIWAFMVITLFITGMDYVCTFHSLCQLLLNSSLHQLS